MSKARGKHRARRDAEFQARMRRTGRLRTIVGLSGFVPLVAALVCTPSAGALPFCAIPREWYLALWAGIFGTFVGLTIRMFRERRDHARAKVSDGSA